MELRVKTFDQLTLDELYELLRLRSQVFVVEQDCVYQDIDGGDKAAVHVMAMEDGVCQGCLRVFWSNRSTIYFRDDSFIDKDVPAERRRSFIRNGAMPEGLKVAGIGRVVTSLDKRGTGLGRLLMEEAVKVVDSHFDDADVVYLEAQKYASGFYARFGFEVCSDDFWEDGIPHVQMILRRHASGATEGSSSI